jgi:hypothetical protein
MQSYFGYDLMAHIKLVMPGLVPGIHVFLIETRRKTWMAGPSPAMTKRDINQLDQID